jgi:hypothetical protein
VPVEVPVKSSAERLLAQIAAAQVVLVGTPTRQDGRTSATAEKQVATYLANIRTMDAPLSYEM